MRRFLLVVVVTLLMSACSNAVDATIAPTAPQPTAQATATRASPVSPTTTSTPTPAVSPTQPEPSAQFTATPVSPTPTTAPEAQINCVSPATLTPALTAGPYFTPNTPERTSLLEPGMSGTKLVLTGYVLTQDCAPIAGARLEFWQADAQGVYDNAGYTLRGHQFTDAQGRYTLETVIPGEYPGRTEHIHVKVQAPDGPELTTQLFFPDQAANQTDRIFNANLVLTLTPTEDGQSAECNFVVLKE